MALRHQAYGAKSFFPESPIHRLTGLEIKRVRPLRYTLPAGNTHSLVGYVAPQDEFDVGGYEVVTNSRYSNLAGMRSPENTTRIIGRFMVLTNSASKV